MVKIPFTPSIYEHAARLIGRSPWDVSRDRDLLFSGHRAAYLRYHHDPIVVGIDIYNLEAEAYGAVICEPHGNGIPAITVPYCTTLEQALDLPPFDPLDDGRIAMAIDAGRQLQDEFPDADVRIPVAGPFSIAFNLRGINDLCLDAVLRPDDTARMLMRLAENQHVLCQAIVDSGLDVAFFESAAAPPILSPSQFHELEMPALGRALAIAESAVGHPVPCIVGGDTYPVLHDILSTGTTYIICNVETDQKTLVQQVRQQSPKVKVRVNMNPSVVVGHSHSAICQEIDRILDLTAGCENCLMGTGALPYETLPENIDLIKRYLED